MKTISTLALSVLLLGSAGLAEAAPLDFLFGHRDDHRDHRDDHHDSDRDHRPRMSTEARAQLRLRDLGYYRGPIDGSFGKGSRGALARFQRDRHIRPSGQLNEVTLRALKI